jgi:hypothetical protein
MNIKYLVFSILISSLYSQDEDLDSMWNSAIWNEIVDIPKTTVYEVDNITAAAGVRGAESEDEVLKYLWYRKKAIREEEI